MHTKQNGPVVWPGRFQPRIRVLVSIHALPTERRSGKTAAIIGSQATQSQEAPMTIRELREKYGKNLKGRQAVNAAIRAELVGGDEALDAAERLHSLTRKLRQHNLPGADDAQKALDAVRRIVEGMADVIAKRYGLGE